MNEINGKLQMYESSKSEQNDKMEQLMNKYNGINNEKNNLLEKGLLNQLKCEYRMIFT